MVRFPLLTVITFLPMAGALIISFFKEEETIKRLAFLFSLITFAISLLLYFRFDPATHKFQFTEELPWIKEYGISYLVGIDGISLFLVLLTTFIMPIAILASFRGITERVKGYMLSMLLLETGMIGVFISLDLFLFYIFWEAMLVPMYFLIGIWGGPRRIYAAIKFFIYTMIGSLLMLVAILYLYYLNYQDKGVLTFNLLKLYSLKIPPETQIYLFLAFALAFAIKVPMFPFHTWLPDAHVEAPTAGSVILAGILLKMGTYGFIRFAMPLFPYATIKFLPLICVLAVIGIIYGALVAMVQEDIKKLVAYSSVSHLGYVMLGLFALNVKGVEGGIYQMLNHGLSTGALFLLVGMIYERRHTRFIKDFGGLSKTIPLFATAFMVVTLSSIGLPGLNGFVGEFLVLVGTFTSSNPHSITYTVFAASGMILSAVYMLWMFQRVMFGPCDKPENQNMKDLTGREKAVLIPIIIFIFWMGIYPSIFLRKMDASVNHFIKQVKSRVAIEMVKE